MGGVVVSLHVFNFNGVVAMNVWRWEAGVRVSPETCKQPPKCPVTGERIQGVFFPPFFSFLFLGLEWFVHSLSCSCAWMACYWDSSPMRIIIIIIIFVDADKMGFLYLIVYLLLWIDGASFWGGFVLNPLFLLLHPSYILILFFFFSSSIRSHLLLFPSHPIIPKPSNSNLLQVAKDWQLSSLLSC